MFYRCSRPLFGGLPLAVRGLIDGRDMALGHHPPGSRAAAGYVPGCAAGYVKSPSRAGYGFPVGRPVFLPSSLVLTFTFMLVASNSSCRACRPPPDT
jgi:hypothetical protein